MQTSKLTRFKFERLLARSQSDFRRGLTAVVVFLPQALAFTAASGIEPKFELYTAIVVGTVVAALVVSRSLQRPYLGIRGREG